MSIRSSEYSQNLTFLPPLQIPSQTQLYPVCVLQQSLISFFSCPHSLSQHTQFTLYMEAKVLFKSANQIMLLSWLNLPCVQVFHVMLQSWPLNSFGIRYTTSLPHLPLNSQNSTYNFWFPRNLNTDSINSWLTHISYIIYCILFS